MQRTLLYGKIYLTIIGRNNVLDFQVFVHLYGLLFLQFTRYALRSKCN